MNKTELIDHIAKKAEITKADAGRALNATLETIIETLTKGEDVALPGFGSFRTTIRAAREEKILVPVRNWLFQRVPCRSSPLVPLSKQLWRRSNQLSTRLRSR